MNEYKLIEIGLRHAIEHVRWDGIWVWVPMYLRNGHWHNYHRRNGSWLWFDTEGEARQFFSKRLKRPSNFWNTLPGY